MFRAFEQLTFFCVSLPLQICDSHRNWQIQSGASAHRQRSDGTYACSPRCSQENNQETRPVNSHGLPSLILPPQLLMAVQLSRVLDVRHDLGSHDLHTCRVRTKRDPLRWVSKQSASSPPTAKATATTSPVTTAGSSPPSPSASAASNGGSPGTQSKAAAKTPEEAAAPSPDAPASTPTETPTDE